METILLFQSRCERCLTLKKHNRTERYIFLLILKLVQ